MKKFLIKYYKHRLNKLVMAEQAVSQYWCIRSQGNIIISASLDLDVCRQEFLFEFYKSLLPKKWLVI